MLESAIESARTMGSAHFTPERPPRCRDHGIHAHGIVALCWRDGERCVQVLASV